jgi:hypothetical protein
MSLDTNCPHWYSSRHDCCQKCGLKRGHHWVKTIKFDFDAFNVFLTEQFNDLGRVIGLRVNDKGYIETFQGNSWIVEEMKGTIGSRQEKGELDDD